MQRIQVFFEPESPRPAPWLRSPCSASRKRKRSIAAFPVDGKDARSVPLLAAHDRFLARDILSPIAMPEFDKSAMDGYAYISEDRFPGL